jgi:DUF3017 family protein
VAGLRSRLPVHAPLALVFAVVAVALLRVFTQHWREGAALLGGALLLAAVLRAVLPTDRVGLLAIRSRPVDILTYLMFGGAMLVLAFTIVGAPFGLGI